MPGIVRVRLPGCTAASLIDFALSGHNQIHQELTDVWLRCSRGTCWNEYRHAAPMIGSG